TNIRIYMWMLKHHTTDYLIPVCRSPEVFWFARTHFFFVSQNEIDAFIWMPYQLTGKIISVLFKIFGPFIFATKMSKTYFQMAKIIFYGLYLNFFYCFPPIHFHLFLHSY